MCIERASKCIFIAPEYRLMCNDQVDMQVWLVSLEWWQHVGRHIVWVLGRAEGRGELGRLA